MYMGNRVIYNVASNQLARFPHHRWSAKRRVVFSGDDSYYLKFMMNFDSRIDAKCVDVLVEVFMLFIM